MRTSFAHGRRTQNNTAQCAGAAAGREYRVRLYVLMDLRPQIQIRILWNITSGRVNVQHILIYNIFA